MNSCKSRPSFLSLASKSPKDLFKFLLRLVESPQERDRTGLFFCDGLRAMIRIRESRKFPPELFVYSPELLFRHPSGYQTLERLKLRYPGVPFISLSQENLAQLSQSPEPQGIGAVVQLGWTPLSYLPPDGGLCYLAMDTVRNPGNLGTVLRTLEAVGGAGLICLPPRESTHPKIDPFAPNVVRASMGAIHSLRFTRPKQEEWENWRSKNQILLVGTSPHTGEDFRSVRYGDRVVLWMGGERKGLSDEQMAQCDRLVRIPMAPTATSDSLNLATATSVLLYEVFNQHSPP